MNNMGLFLKVTMVMVPHPTPFIHEFNPKASNVYFNSRCSYTAQRPGLPFLRSTAKRNLPMVT